MRRVHVQSITAAAFNAQLQLRVQWYHTTTVLRHTLGPRSMVLFYNVVRTVQKVTTFHTWRSLKIWSFWSQVLKLKQTPGSCTTCRFGLPKPLPISMKCKAEHCQLIFMRFGVLLLSISDENSTAEVLTIPVPAGTYRDTNFNRWRTWTRLPVSHNEDTCSPLLLGHWVTCAHHEPNKFDLHTGERWREERLNCLSGLNQWVKII